MVLGRSSNSVKKNYNPGYLFDCLNFYFLASCIPKNDINLIPFIYQNSGLCRGTCLLLCHNHVTYSIPLHIARSVSPLFRKILQQVVKMHLLVNKKKMLMFPLFGFGLFSWNIYCTVSCKSSRILKQPSTKGQYM